MADYVARWDKYAMDFCKKLEDTMKGDWDKLDADVQGISPSLLVMTRIRPSRIPNTSTKTEETPTMYIVSLMAGITCSHTSALKE